MIRLPRRQILIGDAAQALQHLPSDSIDCVDHQPSLLFAQRLWSRTPAGAGAPCRSVGRRTALICRGLARVLKARGSLWLNLGDSFSRHIKFGAPPKSLLAAPERLLLRLMADGWICRGKVVWSKPNPMPSSVTDRLNMTYEVVYHLVRSPRY